MELLKVCDRVDQLMREGKQGLTRSWSMIEIIDTIQAEYGEKAADLARDYIIQEVCNIMDEGKYIDKMIREARREMVNIMLFDKDTTETEIEIVSKVDNSE